MKHLDNQIIDYVSGEMSDIDRIAFEQLMDSDPAIKIQVEEMQTTQSVLGNWSDDAIAIPDFKIPNIDAPESEPKVIQMHHRAPWIKYAASAAAVIALLWLSGLQINSSGNSLTLSFGTPEFHTNIDDRIDLAVNNALEKYNLQQQAQLTQFSSQIGNELNALKVSVNNTSGSGINQKENVKAIMDKLSKAQFAQLESILENYQIDQELKMNASFADLMEYIDDKRIDDLSQIQGAFSQLVAAMDAQQERTDELFQGLVQPISVSVDY